VEGEMALAPNWIVLPAEEFDKAPPLINGDVTLEVRAKLGPSGRILDHFRLMISGSNPLELDTDLGQLIPVRSFRGWRLKGQLWPSNIIIRDSVPDPNPDPRVFWPPGSGSTSQRYGSGSGSGSFYHHAKIIRKTLNPTIL
jgi:hypothetical protein